MWHDLDKKVIDEIKIGKKKKPGTHLQLVESPNGKRYINLWSSLSKQWNIMYRYNVDEAWDRWKRTAERINKK